MKSFLIISLFFLIHAEAQTYINGRQMMNLQIVKGVVLPSFEKVDTTTSPVSATYCFQSNTVIVRYKDACYKLPVKFSYINLKDSVIILNVSFKK